MDDREDCEFAAAFHEAAKPARERALRSGRTPSEQVREVGEIAAIAWEKAIRVIEARHWDRVAEELGV